MNNNIDLYVTRINIHHEVGKDPVIKCAFVTFELGEDTADSIFRANWADWRVLGGIVTEEVDAIVVVIHFLEKAGMRNRNVIALQIIIHIYFQIGMDDVIASLPFAEFTKIKFAGFFRNLA